MACENPRRVLNPRYRDLDPEDVDMKIATDYEALPVDWSKVGSNFAKYIEIPCGICASCERRRLNGYRMRLLNEISRWPRNAFVTLTFNESYLRYLDEECDSNYNKPVLQFLDNLRKKYGKGIRHWFVCEFGKLKGRPHYHGILFNIPESLTSDAIIDSWNRHRQGSRKNKKSQWSFAPSDRGVAYVGNRCDSRTCHYICKYITKEWSFGRVRPRIISSKGIGENYITPSVISAHHRSGQLLPYITTSNDYVVPLPRYYSERIFSDDDRRLMLYNREINPVYRYNGKRFGTLEELESYRRDIFKENVRRGFSLLTPPPSRRRVHPLDRQKFVLDYWKPAAPDLDFYVDDRTGELIPETNFDLFDSQF